MPRRRNVPNWPGELGHRITWTGPATVDPPTKGGLLQIPASPDEVAHHAEERAKAYELVRRAQAQKLKALARHYNMEVTWETLVPLLIRLASDTVPGFMIDYGRTPAGAPQTWTDARNAELMADVEALKRKRSCGDSEACRILSVNPSYRERYGKLTHASLQNQLLLARKAPGFSSKLLRQGPENALDLLIEHFALHPDDQTALPAAKHRTASRKVNK
jgi:hypothetical protein